MGGWLAGLATAVLAAAGVGSLMAGDVLALPVEQVTSAPTLAPDQAPELDPELVRRWELATADALAAGVTLTITSGPRSAVEQQGLLDAAIAEHGDQAARALVLPPHLSAHVTGRAIDVGPADGAAWLAENGSRYGLCLAYANEPWHFEPLVEPGTACPAPAPDASVHWD